MTKYNRPRSEEFREMLATEYLNTNISIKDLSEKYHTDAAYQLQRHGIKLKGRGVQKMLSRTGCIKYNWDATTVTTEAQAYTLGFLMADGYNTGAQVGLKVKTSDLETLKRMKNCFSDEIKLQSNSQYYSFVISSTVICNNLRKLGIIEHKSYREKSLPNLNSDLIRHFIRGYFDGDGTVFVCNSTNPKLLKCYICSSTSNILRQFQQIFLTKGIDCAINIENRTGKEYTFSTYASIATMNMFRLFIRRKCALERFYHYLYDDATIYLERKHKIFTDNMSLLTYCKHVNTELTSQIAKGCEEV